MVDCLIIGGGAVGVSLAYELSRQGLRIRLIERGSLGREASWAGAGIMPPGPLRAGDQPIDQLFGLSNLLHAEWSERLRGETGIDNGYAMTGAVYLARDEARLSFLEQLVAQWRERDVEVQELSKPALSKLEPALSPAELDRVLAAYFLPHETQIRNPRHLQALAAACACQGVEITCDTAAEDFDIAGQRVNRVIASSGPIAADSVCITTGTWSQALVARLGCQIHVKPVRGQIALLNCERPCVRHIINEGLRYLVPRPDGRLLVGSTQEDAGFDRRTTSGVIAELLDFAIRLVPGLKTAELEKCWAGLRPGTLDGLPYLGRVPGLTNAYVAAGHFRSGLQLSPGTAVVMSQLIRGEVPQISLYPFRLDR